MAMTSSAYDFLMGRGDAKEFDYCRNFGWCVGLDLKGRPVLSKRGVRAIKAYQSEQNYRKIEEI